ncbi:hypothetical protein [Croceicoccus sp. BE223]|uniref:hypothetical protein n=1 Tax=Croceicoccus sp. BE223 TaxID=2817716 RepID=UPI00285443E4|nr:hypothetical protein [Croceicoccus sp. BE223]MDR7102914.1 hypothetical protein [Croceicoccus sp. BE223]
MQLRLQGNFMRGSKGRWAILALAIVVLLVYAFIDGGRQEPRWVEIELPAPGIGAPENGK